MVLPVDTSFVLLDVEGYHAARNFLQQVYEDDHDGDGTDGHGRAGDEVEYVDESMLRGAEGSYLCTGIYIHGTRSYRLQNS